MGTRTKPSIPPGMCSTAALHSQEYFGAVAPWGRGTRGDVGALGCCCCLLSIPAGTDGSVLNPGSGRMRQTPAAPISSHWCTWGARGEWVVPLHRKRSWTPQDAQRWGPAAPARPGKAAGSAATQRGIQIASRWESVPGSRKFGEENPHLCPASVPSKQVLTRSCEQAGERKMPPAFIFMSFLQFLCLDRN